jgi:transcriptional regulator with XRE-family HTH domain
VSELERGLVVPTIGTLARVARALEVTIADLVAGETDRERLFEDLRGQPPAVMRDIREHIRRIAASADRDLARRSR